VIDARAKLDFVDAIRGIAILLVLTAHNYLGFLEDNGKYLVKEFNRAHVSHLPILNFFFRGSFIIILSIGLLIYCISRWKLHF